ncbi:helix-turn-helix transcriptional regulator [Sphingobacterium sp. UT-1RO-CII-1]|uniref:helix-turn-helix domain-containing protein n=1 Tax=Sphingobacterium sp. UT-1RO-CII-1 TaxID=2995225 RepID=UPI00227C120B|nr:helix-turn-helix transcriptional regulator [Sphingobacterium sp. UT-1RO-CII-1]MCY4781678.1 helix-turn-helix transcriptional regulator [Sphingobacterium sp. UT-1RO-CII-1]
MRPDKNIRTKEDIARPYDDIGMRIKEWRMSKGLKQTDITGEHVSYSALQMVESGRRAPTVELLRYLYKEQGLDLNFIICGDQG